MFKTTNQFFNKRNHFNKTNKSAKLNNTNFFNTKFTNLKFQYVLGGVDLNNGYDYKLINGQCHMDNYITVNDVGSGCEITDHIIPDKFYAVY